MKKQRIASLALAGTMAMSMAVPALAANETKITAAYKEVTINVVVPTTGDATINPYGLPVKYTLDDGATPTPKVLATAQITGQQITTAPLSIRNQGDVDLYISASATATAGKSATVTLTDKLGKGDTTKKATLSLDVVTNNKLVGDDDAVNKLLYEAVGTDTNWDDATSVAITELDKACKGEELATIKAATLDTDGTTFKTYNAGSVAMFRLSGECVVNPKNSDGEDDAWSTKDSISVAVAFTFTPAVD